MSYEEIRGPLAEWSRRGSQVAIATLVEVMRSAPRPPGARFAINEDGDVAGSISAGCVEGDLYERLVGLLGRDAPELVRYGITDEMALEVGLSCGGEIDVLLSGWSAEDPLWTELNAAIDDSRPAVLITGVSEPVIARRLLLTGAGPEAGGLGEGLDALAAAEAASLFAVGGSRLLSVSDPGSGEDLRLFAEAFVPPPRLIIVGSSEIAVELCRQASGLDFSVTIADPRATFAAPERFPDARVVHAWPEEAFDEIELDPHCWVAVLSHDHKLDVPALELALRSGCVYVGLLGGRNTQAARRESLRERGLDDRALSRIHGPIGLPIGAGTPAEIALSILAEITQIRRG